MGENTVLSKEQHKLRWKNNFAQSETKKAIGQRRLIRRKIPRKFKFIGRVNSGADRGTKFLPENLFLYSKEAY